MPTTLTHVVYPLPDHPSAWCPSVAPQAEVGNRLLIFAPLGSWWWLCHYINISVPGIYCAFSAPLKNGAKRLHMLTHSSSTTNQLVIAVLREASSHFQLGLARSRNMRTLKDTECRRESASPNDLGTLPTMRSKVIWLMTPNVCVVLIFEVAQHDHNQQSSDATRNVVWAIPLLRANQTMSQILQLWS